MIRLAMGQLLVEGGEPERNFERAHRMITGAASRGCELILLPETIDFAWTHPSALRGAHPIPGPYSDTFCEWARQNRIFVCVGLTESASSGERYNAAILIGPDGDILLKHRKINLLDVELPFYEVGDGLRVVDTALGRIGVSICSDNYRESVHLGRSLASMGAQLILSPCAWTVDHGVTEVDDPYRDKWFAPLSYLASMYEVLVVSSTAVGYIVGGPYEGKKMVGCSLAVNHEGILSQGRFNEFAGELICMDAPVPRNPEKGTQLGRKIEERGFVAEMDAASR